VMEDVLDEEAFLARTMDGHEPEFVVLRSALRHSHSIAQVLEVANSLIYLSHSDLDARRVGNTSEGRLFGADGDRRLGLLRFGRRRLEELFGHSVVRQARAIELTTTTHKTEDIIASIPANRRLLLNLSLCRSIELGQAIHRSRPLVRCLVDRRLIDPIVALVRFKQQLLQLSNARRIGQPISYPDAVLRAQAVVMESTS
jgi:hypothetical protein